MELRPNSRAGFTRRIESEILPLLRKQKGFQDEMTFVNPAGRDASSVSLWHSKESANNYSRSAVAEVTRLLSKLAEETPRVKTFEVANSTFRKIAVTQKAAWLVIIGSYFRRRRLFFLLFAAAAAVDFSREFARETDSEKADRLAIERGENEGMAVHIG